jgi:hypothetical protein
MASHTPAPSHAPRRWSGSTPTPTYRAAGAVYRPRRPTETPLYPVVQHHLETFLAEAQEADPMGWGIPTWVERDFRGYLRCGILAHGFARVRCTGCGHDRLLAFSCKARGVCPSCNARRMAEVAAHLTDEVTPHLPVRQWVLSVPKRLRPFLHQTPEVASAVLAIFLRALRAALRDASPGAPAAVRDVQLGAISFPQRFGSSLNPHYHYHVLALDGVVSGDVERGVRFHEAAALEAPDAEALARAVQLRVLRWFVRRGLLDPATAADMRAWQGTGGFSVDGSVRIEGEDRAGLERLVRYCARGPLALERLHAPAGLDALTSPEARLVYRLPEPDVQGRQELRLTPLELLERLARLVPPPRIHRHRYHGVLAPNARLRSTVVSIGRPEPDDVPADAGPPPSPHPASRPVAPPGLSRQAGPSGSQAASPRSRSSRMLWAQLLTRIYEVLPLLCPVCGGEMRIISFITLPSTVQDILLHLDLPHRPPRVSPARGPPQAEFDFDQSPAFDLAAPEVIPEYEFDQSAPHDCEA